MPQRVRSAASAILGALLAALVVFAPSAARAVVEITFYSHEGDGIYFPHAFVTLRGVDDRTGRRVHLNYGFTTPQAGPHVLSGPVTGVLEQVQPEYIAGSTAHFTVALSSREVGSVIAVAEKWRRLPQPSYELWTQNCVVFVAEIAARLGMQAGLPQELITAPGGYLDHLTQTNQPWLAARRARLHPTD
jgi:hypothetical protein